MQQAALAALNTLARTLVQTGTLTPVEHSRAAALLTKVLATHRVLMPWRVVRAAKRLDLPYQNPQFAEDVLGWLCKRNGSEAISYLVAEMRAKGWVIPGNWGEQRDLFEDHGFAVVPHPTRKYAYCVTL
jgi:hypothetical protein